MKLSSFTNGLIKENPVFYQLLGMCPTLAVTTSLQNGIGMGVATTSVLIASNILVSLVRKIVPDKIRIPIFIVVIATFVSVVEMLLEGFVPPLYNALGLFIPLIVVNCIILARAEAFAYENGVLDSMLDGLGMGLGFPLALTLLGFIREFLGTGGIELFGTTLFQLPIPATISMILPPGAFLVMGMLIALVNKISKKEA